MAPPPLGLPDPAVDGVAILVELAALVEEEGGGDDDDDDDSLCDGNALREWSKRGARPEVNDVVCCVAHSAPLLALPNEDSRDNAAVEIDMMVIANVKKSLDTNKSCSPTKQTDFVTMMSWSE